MQPPERDSFTFPVVLETYIKLKCRRRKICAVRAPAPGTMVKVSKLEGVLWVVVIPEADATGLLFSSSCAS